MKELTYEDLLHSLRNPVKKEPGKLANSKETWARIGKGDLFEELDLEGSELDSFLEEWMADNPYSDL